MKCPLGIGTGSSSVLAITQRTGVNLGEAWLPSASISHIYTTGLLGQWSLQMGMSLLGGEQQVFLACISTGLPFFAQLIPARHFAHCT